MTRYPISFPSGAMGHILVAGDEWAAKIADSCRCAQELREVMPDPAAGN